jgi:nitronate monooxygenase
MNSRIETRLTRALRITHPVLSAPMALTAGGTLAAAVSCAGGLGLIGGGYGDAGFLEAAYRDAGNARTGCGFITWSLAKKPELLDLVLAHKPAALMLSFGDPAPFSRAIRDSGAMLICQCQNMTHVRAALDAGAGAIVAQGAEAGGHGATRGTLSFVAEVADFLAHHAPEALLLAAGGIADGRGLAAALMLGADGVLVGTRFWAATEALSPQGHQLRAVASDGDSTLRTKAVDVVRELDWPEGFTIRVGRNAFTDRWHGHEDELRAALAVEIPAYKAALAAGDAERSAPVYGEAAGLIHAIEPAADILARMISEAIARLEARGGAMLV